MNLSRFKSKFSGKHKLALTGPQDSVVLQSLHGWKLAITEVYISASKPTGLSVLIVDTRQTALQSIYRVTQKNWETKM